VGLEGEGLVELIASALLVEVPPLTARALPLEGVGMMTLLGRLKVTAPVELETAISFAVPASDVTPPLDIAHSSSYEQNYVDQLN
jgi:hypothetical protein